MSEKKLYQNFSITWFSWREYDHIYRFKTNTLKIIYKYRSRVNTDHTWLVQSQSSVSLLCAILVWTASGTLSIYIELKLIKWINLILIINLILLEWNTIIKCYVQFTFPVCNIGLLNETVFLSNANHWWGVTLRNIG